MNAFNLFSWPRWVLAVALAASTTQTFGFKQGDLRSEPNHQIITAEAIGSDHLVYTLNNWKPVSFSYWANTEVQYANGLTDDLHFSSPEFHFDEERFSGPDSSVAHLYRLKEKIVDEMRKASPDSRKARFLLGLASHTVQDFYAHSNWVEINRQRKAFSLPPLKHPSFGSSPDSRVVFFGIGLADANLPSLAAACDKSKMQDSPPLTTGYFDVSMSTPFGAGDLGFSTGPWKERALASIAANELPPNFASTADAAWPDNGCVHGGNEGSGLNKDQEGRDQYLGAGVFAEAKAAATQATRKFVLSVLDSINNPTPGFSNRGICLLLGHTPLSDCDESPVTPTVSSVVPQSAFALYGHDVTVTVTGTNLPLSTRVEMKDGICGAPSEQSPTTIVVACTPGGNPGAKSITVRQYDSQSAPVLGTTEVALLIGLIQDAPTLSLILETISLVANWVWDQVQTIVWSFSDKTDTVSSTVVGGQASAPPSTYTTSGEKTITATFKDLYDAVIGATSATFTVLPATVESVIAPAVTLGESLTFIVRGSNLPQGLTFALGDCINVKEVVLSGSPSERRFTCLFPPGTTAGMKDGAIAAMGTAGNPFAAALKTFSVAVSLPAAPSVSRFTVSPAAPNVGDIITLSADGKNLQGSGFQFSNFTPCDTGGAVAPSILTDTLMSYQCVAKKATAISYVGVLDASGTPLSGIGQSLIVYCAGGLEPVSGVCPEGTAINLPATSFVRGENVALSANGYGADAVMNAPPYGTAANAAEWDFTVPTAGTYELFAEYAAAQSRPVVISFNGVVKFNSALSAVTGGWYPADRQVISQGTVQLAAGATTMRVARGDVFPHIRGFKLIKSSMPASAVVNPANGHGYAVVECGSWTACRIAARAMGGELATIRSSGENDWLVANILPLAKTEYGLWIGLTDETQEGVWRWSSGEPVAFTNWRVGEPNNTWLDGRAESYVHMWKGNANPSFLPGVWNDIVDEPMLSGGTSSIIVQAIVEYP